MLPADGTFDHQRPYGSVDPPTRGFLNRTTDLVESEVCSSCGKGHHVDPAQLLHAVSGIVIEVALLLDDCARAATAKQPDRQVIGECTARHEDRVFLAQQTGNPLFQLAHHAAIRVIVSLDPSATDDVGQRGH